MGEIPVELGSMLVVMVSEGEELGSRFVSKEGKRGGRGEGDREGEGIYVDGE